MSIGQLVSWVAFLASLAAGLSFLAEWLQPEEGLAMMGWTIIGVIVINAVFAFFQEYRTEHALRTLQHLLPSQSWVLRLGQPQEVSREQLVPGDILLLEEGERTENSTPKVKNAASTQNKKCGINREDMAVPDI